MYYPARVRFKKLGEAKYISHLDLNKAMARAFSRAKIPVWYTEGFNPHCHIVFGPPLPVGYTSDCEVMDIRVDTLPPEEVLERLNKALPICLSVYDVKAGESPNLNEIAFARYELIISNSSETSKVLNNQELFVTKTDKKKREKQVDVMKNASVNKVETDALNDLLKINIDLPAQSGGEFISPELFIRAVEVNSGLSATHVEGRRISFLKEDKSVF